MTNETSNKISQDDIKEHNIKKYYELLASEDIDTFLYELVT